MKRVALFLAVLALAAPVNVADAQSGSGVRIRIIYYGSQMVMTGEYVQYCDGSWIMNGQPDVNSDYFEYDC